MVHVRQVNGKTEVFGNQGALFMNAMTWWDHTTESVWSQVWGRAIQGPLKGTELELIPAQTVPWGSWKAQHPNTLLMSNGLDRVGFRSEQFRANYVIGVELEGVARGYPYLVASQTGVLNDQLGEHPVVVVVNPDTKAVTVYLRRVEDQVLTFVQRNGELVDEETGTVWDPVRGLALRGPLEGQALRPIPYVPAFASAWQDFFPETTFFEDPG